MDPKPAAETLNTLLDKMRSDKKSYTWFYDDVLSCVVGKKHWRKHCTHATGMKLASVSDEALGLLILENNWAPWCLRSGGPDSEDLLVVAFGETLEEGDDRRANLSWETMTTAQRKKAANVRARYMLGLTKYTTKSQGTRGCKGTGWSDEGMDRFNALCKAVIKSRETNEGVFDTEYMAEKKSGSSAACAQEETSALTVYCDLSE